MDTFEQLVSDYAQLCDSFKEQLRSALEQVKGANGLSERLLNACHQKDVEIFNLKHDIERLKAENQEAIKKIFDTHRETIMQDAQAERAELEALKRK